MIRGDDLYSRHDPFQKREYNSNSYSTIFEHPGVHNIKQCYIKSKSYAEAVKNSRMIIRNDNNAENAIKIINNINKNVRTPTLQSNKYNIKHGIIRAKHDNNTFYTPLSRLKT